MALTGTQKAYLQARAGIARSGAIRSNYVFPLYGVVTVGGVDLTTAIRYGSLRVGLALNEQPDTCGFDAFVTTAAIQSALVVGADVVIGLGGAADNPLFGGRILTVQTTRNPASVSSLRSVLCADYLQVLDSEYLITYDWPSQSATTTILDLFARFSGKAGGVVISTAAVQAGLPTHQAIAVTNERFSTVLRKIVTMFPAGGGFYIDPIKVLHVWSGNMEAGIQPQPLEILNPTLKQFAETVDGAQIRDAVLVEGARTSAPIGTPPAGDYAASPLTFPVDDASIVDRVTDQAGREIRVGSQRYLIRYAHGAWSAPVNNPTSTTCSAVAYNPTAGGDVVIPITNDVFLNGRPRPCWVKVNDMYLLVKSAGGNLVTVPRVGFGCQTGPIQNLDVMYAIDSFGGGTTTGRYDKPGAPEVIRAQPVDADVVMTVRTSQSPAVHEHFVQDGRYSRAGAADRGAREIADFAPPTTSINFESDDLNCKPGRQVEYSFVDPGLAEMHGRYMILTAELTWPKWGEPPRRVCYAAHVEAADVVDAWLVDKR